MTRIVLAALVTLAVPLALPGCTASTDSFPSLAPRPIERLDTTEPAAPAPAAEAADPALAAQVAALLAEAEAGQKAFDTVHAETAPRIRAGAAVQRGADAWIAAQQALSRLAAARERTAAALQSLDALAIARNDDPAVTPARDRAAALDRAQQESLATLEAILPSD